MRKCSVCGKLSKHGYCAECNAVYQARWRKDKKKHNRKDTIELLDGKTTCAGCYYNSLDDNGFSYCFHDEVKCRVSDSLLACKYYDIEKVIIAIHR